MTSKNTQMRKGLNHLIEKIIPKIIACLQKLLDSTKDDPYQSIVLESLKSKDGP